MPRFRSLWAITLLLGGCVGALDGGSPGAAPVAPLRPVSAGIRTLTPSQYEASVRDVLGLGLAGSSVLGGDAPIGPLGQWATAIGAARGSFSPTTVESYETGARDAAAWVFADASRRDAIVGCTPSSAPGDSCARDFLERIGRRAYRRSLTADELTRWTTLAESIGVSLGDPARGLEHALSGILQSAHFLYRVEIGEDDPASADPTQLRYTDHEMATRLSYLVWGTTPDEALIAAADRGELSTDAGLSEALSRLLDDPRAEVGLEAFVADLFEVDGLLTAERDPVIHPDFLGQRDALRRSLTRTAATALSEGGFHAVFTTRTVFVDASIAGVFGLDPADFGTELARVELPADSPRAGLLTQPGFLALHAYPGKTSPALRGLFVRRRLLCQEILPPPPSVSTVLPEPPAGRLVTTRELVSLHQRQPSCAGCHRYMDPIGLGLEHFDEVGAHRERQNDLPIDASGDLDGAPFEDAIGLGRALAEHRSLGPCMASRLYAFAAGSTVPSRHPSVRALAGEGTEVRALFEALVLSELFRQAHSPDDVIEGGP